MADDGSVMRGAASPIRLVLAFAIPAALVVLTLAAPALSSHQGVVALAIAVAAAVPLFLLFSQRARARTVEDGIRQLSRGELGRAIPMSDDETYSGIFSELEGLRRTFQGQIKDMALSTDDQDRVLAAARRNIEELASGVQKQVTSVEETAASLQQMTASLKGIAENVEVLASAAEESSSSILEMAAANAEVSDNMATLAASVQESASSIEEMTFSIKEVAKNVEDLSSTAEETSSSMNEMDISIHQVETNANETARLSEEVTRAAGLGVEAINQTIQGINRIKDSSEEAVRVIVALNAKIGEIGKILEVIDDVAEQTNLLALNAAIIAAQAGEHGKGFAVVADEIKDLAERAGGSTKEIAELIKTIQSESKNAISAVERGAVNVSRGVVVSNEAERALKKILESSQKSTTMVRAIARATVEQAKGSKQVTDSIGRIAETVQQIAAATAQQARGSDLIMKSAEKMRMITQHVERSSQEQSRGGKQITEAIEQISSMVNAINASHRNRGNGQELIDMARAIDERVRAQNKALARMKLLGERIGVGAPK